ncbi:MAG: TolC family outer membrane protein [Legionellales bacterium]|nr:TolC family outer membrane protein [Legionellales bacterium]
MNKLIYILTTILGIAIVTSTFSVTLQEAAQRSLLTSPRVLETVKVCLANDQAYRGAVGGYFPTLDATGAIGYERSENNTTRAEALRSGSNRRRTLLRREIGLEARQMLFDGFSTMHNVSRNRFKLNASSWAVSDQANAHSLRVAEAYINVLREREIIESAKENVKIHTRTAEMISRRSESGVSRNTDAVQALGRLAQASSNLKSAEGHLMDAETSFFRVSGMRARGFTTPKISNKCFPKSEKKALEQAIEYHPALRAANSDILEAVAQYRESNSTMMPHIDLVGGISFNNNLDGVKGENNDQRVMLEGRWNLLNGGRDIRRKRETAYLAQQSAEIRNNTYREIIENTKLAWIAYKTNTGLIGYFKKHMEASRDTIDAYAKQFQLGQRTLLDLLNSENEYFSSKTIYINTKYDILLSQYRLLAAMGLINDELNVDLTPLGAASPELNDLTEYPEILQENNQSYSRTLSSSSNNSKNKDARYRQKILKVDDKSKDYSRAKIQEYHEKKNYYNNANKLSRRMQYKQLETSNVTYQHKDGIKNTERDIRVDSSKHDSKVYTIQLVASGNEAAVNRFIRNSGIDGVANYYRAKKKNGDEWYIVTYGKYDSKRSAMLAMNNLPDKMKIYTPWARTINSIHPAELVYGSEDADNFV